ALAEKSKIDRQPFDCPEHHLNVPTPGGDGRAVRAVGGPDAATEEGGDAVAQGCIDLLWRDEMDVPVVAGRCQDQVFGCDGIRGRADRESRSDTVHGTGIAGLTDAHDLAVLDADIGFDDA